jgi:hypothetical protein
MLVMADLVDRINLCYGTVTSALGSIMIIGTITDTHPEKHRLEELEARASHPSRSHNIFLKLECTRSCNM